MKKEGLEKLAVKVKPGTDESIEKILPVVESSLHKFLGVKIQELTKDITDRITRGSIAGIEIDTSLGFKAAKKKFKEAYLKKLLTTNYGNISLVAKIADVDRRSIHRLLSKSKKDLKQIRHEMLKKDYVKRQMIGKEIESILPNYESVIHPGRLKEVYANIDEVSGNIAAELDEELLTMKDAEEEFEKEFFRQALEENKNNIAETAKKIKIRYETLHRKLKKLGLV